MLGCIQLHPDLLHGILTKCWSPQVLYRPHCCSDLPQIVTSSITGSRIRGSLLLGTYFCRITCFSSSWLGALRGRANSWDETGQGVSSTTCGVYSSSLVNSAASGTPTSVPGVDRKQSARQLFWHAGSAVSTACIQKVKGGRQAVAVSDPPCSLCRKFLWSQLLLTADS